MSLVLCMTTVHAAYRMRCEVLFILFFVFYLEHSLPEPAIIHKMGDQKDSCMTYNGFLIYRVVFDETSVGEYRPFGFFFGSRDGSSVCVSY